MPRRNAFVGANGSLHPSIQFSRVLIIIESMENLYQFFSFSDRGRKLLLLPAEERNHKNF